MIPASIPKVPLSAERSPWLRGRIQLPGDPALSAAALILAAMARGESVLDNIGGAQAEAVAAILRRGIGLFVCIREIPPFTRAEIAR